MSTTPSATDNKWVICRKPRPDARLRLFCFGYAGANATLFHPWPDEVPDDVEVRAIQLPGRANRLAEPAFTDMDQLMAGMIDVLQLNADQPYALFGYSLGTLIAFELTRRARAAGLPQPVHLFVAAREAPHLKLDPPISHLPEPEFINELKQRYGGMSDELFSDPDLRALFVPILRADFELLDSYQCRPEPLLTCPITVFGGDDDLRVPRDALAEWKLQTSGPFRLEAVPGGHFFITTQRPLVMDTIREELTDR